MNNALWSPRGAQARERTHAAGYTVSVLHMLGQKKIVFKKVRISIYATSVKIKDRYSIGLSKFKTNQRRKMEDVGIISRCIFGCIKLHLNGWLVYVDSQLEVL